MKGIRPKLLQSASESPTSTGTSAPLNKGFNDVILRHCAEYLHFNFFLPFYKHCIRGTQRVHDPRPRLLKHFWWTTAVTNLHENSGSKERNNCHQHLKQYFRPHQSSLVQQYFGIYDTWQCIHSM